MLRRDLLERIATWAAAVVGLETDALPVDVQRPARGDETAVVDRIEDGTAVVVFEDSDRERTVPPPVLPPDAREAGTVLRVPGGEALALAEVDRAATRERRQTAQERFDELAERPPDE